MNTKRMILLVPLMILTSCGGKPADPGGASTPQGVPDASAQPAREDREPPPRPGAGTPVRNGPYVVCSIKEYNENQSPELSKDFKLEIGDRIDINSEEVAGAEVGLVSSVTFHRDSDSKFPKVDQVQLHMVGCCDRQTLATTHRPRDTLRLITIVDETKRYKNFPDKFCPDLSQFNKKFHKATESTRLITVRFCSQEPDAYKKPVWECPENVNPHGGDVHAVNP
jgi:hypothetical protein